MPASPPTKYTPKLLEKAQWYVDGGWKDEGDTIPTIEGLALVLGIRRETLWAWEKEPDKHQISNILGELKEIQARGLINKSLIGEYNSTIAKMLLSGHGYVEETKQSRDQRYVDVDGKDLHKADLDALSKIGINVT